MGEIEAPRSTPPRSYSILTYPKHERLLRTPARTLRDDEFGSQDLYDLVVSLSDLMFRNGGTGLAANQVSHPAPTRVFVMRAGDGLYGAFCNPEIVSERGHVVGPEGCLSFASVTEMVGAPELVALRFRNPDGVLAERPFTGQQARCVFHETQHLGGTLLVDRMSGLKKALFVKSVAKAQGRR